MIRDRLEQLKPEQKRQLMYAFEHDMGQYVKLNENYFIGVNVKPIRNLEILESAGVWAYGRIHKRNIR